VSTVGATEYLRSSLNAVANNPARTMSTGWRDRSDRTFEAVKSVMFATYDDVKAFVVLVATSFAGRHENSFAWASTAKSWMLNLLEMLNAVSRKGMILRNRVAIELSGWRVIRWNLKGNTSGNLKPQPVQNMYVNSNYSGR
jgi:hypothetical protein